MAETLRIEVEEFMITYTRYTNGEYSLKEHSNGDCVFLEHDPEGCRIYKFRPAQCRTFPFWQNIMCRETVWDSTARKCPGMDSGIFLTEEDIEKRILTNG